MVVPDMSRISQSPPQGNGQFYAIVHAMLLILISVVAEGLLYAIPGLWKYKRILVGLPLVLTAFSSVFLSLSWWNIAGSVILLAGIFRVINQLRLAKERMHEAYLRRVTLQTFLILAAFQLFVLLVGFYWPFTLTHGAFLFAISATQLLFALGVFIITFQNIIKTRARSLATHYSDKELPTLTVAIPARNETTDLETCLKSVLANDYPKLEVLVLDDCSQDKTAEIIRSFAHDGVRFVQGEEPKENWLAKNQAYDKLADEASGELILFCGVDVRFEPGTLRAIVSSLLTRKKSMLSILPRRFEGKASHAAIQPMRYWWELALPRRLFNRPPVLSTCWIIRRQALQKMGGFEAVRRAIIPEGYFARELIKTDAYSFLRADNELAIQTEKKLADQYDTAIRVHYPQIHKRPEIALLLTIVQIAFMLGPFLLLLSGFWEGFGWAQTFAGAACGLLIVSNVAITHISSPVHTMVAFFNLPIAIVIEVSLGMISMLRYEFSVVEWRGRNVCIPVMHVYPRLPKV